MNITSRIRAILQKTLVLQIATCVNNTPWVCTVCFAYDNEFNLYWFSRHAARHSQEILKNPIVAGAVAGPYKFGVKPEGLQFAGTAEEVHDERYLLKGLLALQKRYSVTEERTQTLQKELELGSVDYGLYKLSPQEIVLYDTKHAPDNPRQVYMVPTKARV